MKKRIKQTDTGRKVISKRRDIINRLLKNRNAVIGLVIVFIIIFVAAFAGLLVDYDTEVIKANHKQRLQKPNSEHILGTDELGRDLLCRLIYACRMSVMIGVLATIAAVGLGILIGAVAGYFGGWVDSLLMRICDIFEGIPSFLLAITITAAFGTTLLNLMIAMGLAQFATQARVIRGSVMTIKDQEYIEAAKAMGASDWQIIWNHVVPNDVAVIIVQATLKIGGGILAASSLSFLGLGVQPPDPEWGAMLSAGRSHLLDNPYLTLFPGLCIMITILAFNMLGDGLRDALDPRMKG